MTTSANGIEARLEVYRVAFDLSGKIALVLGAASGIGKASAEALAALRSNVICADRDRDGVGRIVTGDQDNASAGRRRSVPLADIPPFT